MIIVVGVALIVIGGVLSMSYSKDARRSGASQAELLAQGAVPKWVSVLYLLGFVVTIVGIISAVA